MAETPDNLPPIGASYDAQANGPIPSDGGTRPMSDLFRNIESLAADQPAPTPRPAPLPPLPASSMELWQHVVDLRVQVAGLTQRLDNTQPATPRELPGQELNLDSALPGVRRIIEDRADGEEPGVEEPARRTVVEAIQTYLNTEVMAHYEIEGAILVRANIRGQEPSRGRIRLSLRGCGIATGIRGSTNDAGERSRRYSRVVDDILNMLYSVGGSRMPVFEHHAVDTPAPTTAENPFDAITIRAEDTESVWRLGYYEGIDTSAHNLRCAMGNSFGVPGKDKLWRWTPVHYTGEDEETYPDDFFDRFVNDGDSCVIPAGDVWAVVKGPRPTADECQKFFEEYMQSRGQQKTAAGPTRRINIGGQSERQST